MEQRGFTADSRDPLLCEHNVSPLEGMRQTGPLDRYITEVERNAGAHQWIRLVADAEEQMRLSRVAWNRVYRLRRRLPPGRRHGHAHLQRLKIARRLRARLR